MVKNNKSIAKEPDSHQRYLDIERPFQSYYIDYSKAQPYTKTKLLQVEYDYDIPKASDLCTFLLC